MIGHRNIHCVFLNVWIGYSIFLDWDLGSSSDGCCNCESIELIDGVVRVRVRVRLDSPSEWNGVTTLSLRWWLTSHSTRNHIRWHDMIDVISREVRFELLPRNITKSSLRTRWLDLPDYFLLFLGDFFFKKNRKPLELSSPRNKTIFRLQSHSQISGFISSSS